MLVTLFTALFVIYTKIFGIFYFITPAHIPLNFHKDLIRSANIVIKDFAWIFNLVPGKFQLVNFNATAPGWFSFIVVLLLVLAIGIKVGRKVAANPVLLNFFVTIVLSSIIILFSFFALDKENNFIDITNARYLINILFFLVLGIGVAVEFHWQDLSKSFKLSGITIVLLYLISSISSTLPLLELSHQEKFK